MTGIEIAAVALPSAISLATGGKTLMPTSPAGRLRNAQKYIDETNLLISQPFADGIPEDEMKAMKDDLVL